MAETRWFGRIADASPALQWLSGVSADYAATAFLVVCVALVFYFIPNAPVRFRDVWPGAILVGVLWRVRPGWLLVVRPRPGELERRSTDRLPPWSCS